jgi:hypothetical protein
LQAIAERLARDRGRRIDVAEVRARQDGHENLEVEAAEGFGHGGEPGREGAASMPARRPAGKAHRSLIPRQKRRTLGSGLATAAEGLSRSPARIPMQPSGQTPERSITTRITYTYPWTRRAHGRLEVTIRVSRPPHPVTRPGHHARPRRSSHPIGPDPPLSAHLCVVASESALDDLSTPSHRSLASP